MTLRQLFTSLQARLLLVAVVAVTPPFLALVSTADAWRRHESADAEAEALRLARYASVSHDRLLRQSEAFLAAVAEGAAARSADLEVPTLLAGFSDVQGTSTNLGFVRPDGTTVRLAPLRVSVGDRIAGHPVLRRAMASRTFTVGSYEFDQATGRRSVTVAYRTAERARPEDPVAFAVLDSTWLAGFVADADFPPGTSISILDGRGAVVLHESDPWRWGQGTDQLEAGVAKRLAEQREGVLEDVAPGHLPRLFGVTRLRSDSGSLFVAVGIPQSSAIAAIDSALRNLRWRFAAALVLAFIVVPLGLRWSVTKPLKVLSEAVRRVSLGELHIRTGLEDAPLELAPLARAVDEMAITLERREKEVSLQTQLLTSQERRFRALIENAADGVVLIGEDGLVRYVSPSTTRLVGYTAGELIGQSLFTHIHPDDAAPQLARFIELVRSPGSTVDACFRLQHKDGSCRWIESTGTNLLADPAVRAVVANYRDITARLETQEQLRLAHAELESRVEARTGDLLKANEALQSQIAERERIERNLLKLWRAVEQTTDCMFLTDREGVIEYVNPAFEAVTGYTAAEAIGATPRLIRSGQHHQRFYERLWQTILAGQVFRSVFINRRKDGRLYYEDRTITPVRDQEGTITHFVSTGRDITKTRRTEEALRRMNARLEGEASRIAGVLHDEAGQFLTAAHITLADVARELPANARERLQGVRGNLDEIEGQLRRLSHELRPRILDDVGLVEALKFLAEGVARRTGLDVRVVTSIESRCCPEAETAIYRLVQEGLTNVSRHAQATRVTISLSSDPQAVQCVVQDDGVGFSPANIRGQAGLGLVGIQDRLEAVSGLLEIISSPGQGTTLRATIPLEN